MARMIKHVGRCVVQPNLSRAFFGSNLQFRRHMATGDAPKSSADKGKEQNGRDLSENNRDSRGDKNHEASAPERRNGQTTGGSAPPGDHELPAELFGQHTKQEGGRKVLDQQEGGGDGRSSWGAAVKRSFSSTTNKNSTVAETAASAKDFVKETADAAKNFVKEKAGTVVDKAENVRKGPGTSGKFEASGVHEIRGQENLEKIKAEKTDKQEADEINQRLKRMEEEGLGKPKVSGSPYTEPGSSKSSGPTGKK